MAAKTWTDEELATLRELWGNKTTIEIAQVLGRSRYSVSAKGRDLKLGKTKLPSNFPIKSFDEEESYPEDYRDETSGDTLRGIELDKAMSKLVSPKTDVTYACKEVREAIEVLLYALMHNPITKENSKIALTAFTLLDLLDGI